MNYLIKTNELKSIEKHLEFDDRFLLKLSKNNSSIYLRIWELNYHCIILGRSNKEEKEVFAQLAHDEQITIIKRSSGGGTVILGPGCLCYSLFIPTSFTECTSIGKTNTYVMNQLKWGLSHYSSDINVKGITDLCIGDKKFSGNAQRRLKDTLLFHGTFLYNFDLKIIDDLLRHPSKEPGYRNKRSHNEFITNLALPKNKIYDSIIKAFQCNQTLNISL